MFRREVEIQVSESLRSREVLQEPTANLVFSAYQPYRCYLALLSEPGLNAHSPFPSSSSKAKNSFATYSEYANKRHGVQLTHPEDPLLEVMKAAFVVRIVTSLHCLLARHTCMCFADYSSSVLLGLFVWNVCYSSLMALGRPRILQCLSQATLQNSPSFDSGNHLGILYVFR